MLQQIAPDLWHTQQPLRFAGLDITSRMTVVRLPEGRLWLHSPVRLTEPLARELAALGEVAFVVAPSKSHTGFIGGYRPAYPRARFFGVPGVGRVKPALAHFEMLAREPDPAWAQTLDQTLFEGIPALNEAVWFHRPSRTLILTDLLQWIRADLPLRSRFFAHLTGVRRRLALPLQLKLFTRDRAAARASRARILAWPFERVIVGHDVILEQDAKTAVSQALAWFG